MLRPALTFVAAFFCVNAALAGEAPSPIDPRDLALANALFPSVSQERERTQFLIEQMRRREANEINRAKPLTSPVR